MRTPCTFEEKCWYYGVMYPLVFVVVPVMDFWDKTTASIGKFVRRLLPIHPDVIETKKFLDRAHKE